MSKIIATAAIDGAVEWVVKAETILEQAIQEFGEDAAVGFPSTAYYLPVIYGFTGIAVETLADCRTVLKEARDLLPARPAENTWLPYLGNTLDAGAAALFACEIIEACKYLVGPNPVNGIWLGAANDVIMRERGIEFVDGTAPGFAAICGSIDDNKMAVQIAKELQQKNLYVFMGGCTNGKQFAEQLAEEGVQLGWETRLVPFGSDVSALIYALGFASRAAMSFGGVQPGDYHAHLKYNKDRIFAFVLAMGEVTPEKYAAAAGAINYGFPTIADTDIPEILPTGVCTYEHVVANVPLEDMVERALEIRGCKIKIVDVPVPVAYGPAFEGERIRKEDTHVEFGGNKTSAFEYVTMVETDEITDGDIEIIGPDIDEIEPGTALPLAIWVEAAGRKLQIDFEPILERQIHHMVNGAEGIWHMGQRDIVWTRVSKDGFAKGLRLRHYGEILHAKLLADYPAIVDKVKVTLVTDHDEVEKRLAIARKVYDERNRRLEAMTDESVEIFYSCLLCQSFAPNHVCVITPERLGLCGAYNWLDGKAAHEIDPTGPNQPVSKGTCLDPVKGVWEGVNDYAFTNSHKVVDRFAAYSIMDSPMTSCGCFEAIVAYVPECNGVMVVNREFLGETPIGMSFSTLAGSVGGGVQTPGFIGVGKVFLTSKKFLSAEGGYRRLLWMPRELKELVGEDMKKRLEEQGCPELFDMIADETVATSAAELREFAEKVGHPALTMDDMTDYMQKEEDSAPAQSAAKTEKAAAADNAAAPEPAEASGAALSSADIETLKEQLATEVRASVTAEVVSSIIDVLSQRFLGKAADLGDFGAAAAPAAAAGSSAPAGAAVPKAADVIAQIKSFPVETETLEESILEVKLGATKEEGGTRGLTYTVGGSNCMPFHLYEGKMPHRPLIAMEVFDTVSEKYPDVLREIYGDLLNDPAAMAQACVSNYGADMISVRLDGTHPEKGGRTPQQAVDLVGEVLKAVDVPLIVTGHSHYDSNNEVFKAIAQTYEGENLLLNWVEQDNYRTIAGAAMAYGHTLVSQAPIDVNISKQMNILLTNMGLPQNRIIMDPLTSSIGYGVEYTYSVMERIRLTGLGGDKMLCSPMLVTPGFESAKAKEFKAPEADYPLWGDVKKRSAIWELTTAISLLHAGADILVMYHPEAAKATKETIFDLLDGQAK